MQISKTIHEVREYFNPKIQLFGFLFTMSDPTVNTKTSLQILRQTYTRQVFKTIVPRNTDIRDAHFHHKDIFTYAPASKSAAAYTRLLFELFFPMKKQLPTDEIANELTGASVFFQKQPHDVEVKPATFPTRNAKSSPKAATRTIGGTGKG